MQLVTGGIEGEGKEGRVVESNKEKEIGDCWIECGRNSRRGGRIELQ